MQEAGVELLSRLYPPTLQPKPKVTAFLQPGQKSARLPSWSFGFQRLPTPPTMGQ
jgi:hypothetical protein